MADEQHDVFLLFGRSLVYEIENNGGLMEVAGGGSNTAHFRPRYLTHSIIVRV